MSPAPARRCDRGRRAATTRLAGLATLAGLVMGLAAGPLAARTPGGAAAAGPEDGVGAAPKVLRYAFRVAETGFDPAQIVDLYSRIVTAHVFEGLYGYDPLARPALIRP